MWVRYDGRLWVPATVRRIRTGETYTIVAIMDTDYGDVVDVPDGEER